VYFGDLDWRSVGAVGNRSIYTYENDTGTDGANHDRKAFFSMRNLPDQPMGKVEGLSLTDVGPTVLKLFGLEGPAGASGRSFL
jgi:predicted AlkP superfamily phosphohydrolase/phosphomutase